MITSLTIVDLETYLLSLTASHIPDGYAINYSLRSLIKSAMERIEYCFSHIHRRYYLENGQIVFNHLNGDHMASLLYFLGNTIWQSKGDEEFPTRLFYLNKILHGIDLYFSVPMPKIFLLVHPVGTVIGKAEYDDYLVIYQNCTVGSSNHIYPKIGKEVILYSKTSIIGDCHIGSNVVLGANSLVLNTNVPNDTMVVGQYPKHNFKQNSISVRQRCFEAL